MLDAVSAAIRDVPDFPKPGILFYDISTLLRHGPAWAAAMTAVVTGRISTPSLTRLC